MKYFMNVAKIKYWVCTVNFCGSVKSITPTLHEVQIRLSFFFFKITHRVNSWYYRHLIKASLFSIVIRLINELRLQEM